jgi:glucokinase
LGLGLSDIFNLLGLEAVVIGGGAAPVMEFLMPELLKEFTSRVFAVDPRRVRITRSELGPDAPLVGAAALFESPAEGV